MPSTRSGARLLVDQLLIQGVNHAFGVPGESYLAVLDALYDAREMISWSSTATRAAPRSWPTPTPSSPASPAWLIVTRGPGATNAAIGDPHRAPGFDADGRVRSARSATTSSSARRSRRSTTGACSARWPSGSPRSTAPTASPSTSPAPSRSRPAAGPGPVVLALPEDMRRRPRMCGRACHSRSHAGAERHRSSGCARCSAARSAPSCCSAAAGWTAARLRGPALRRGERAAGGLRVPVPGPLRQPPPELLRRRRHRHQPEARRAHPRSRPGARDRRAPRRDDDLGLHPARGAGAAPDAGPRAPRASRNSGACTRRS